MLTRLLKMKGCRSFPPLSLLLVFVLWGGWLHCSTVADHHGLGCRTLRLPKPVDGYALQGHVIENISLKMETDDVRFECRVLCGAESTCVSINIGQPTNDGVSLCQLSNSDHIRHPDDLKPQEGFLYWATKNPCNSDPCLHNAKCLSGFTDKRYICLCQAGYTGEHCEIDIDECTMEIDNCSQNAMCNNSEGSFNCSCKPGFSGDGTNCADIDECAMGIDNCSPYTICNNTEGSFNCTCKDHFRGNGNNLTDAFNPVGVAFKGDNGKYLGRVHRGGIDFIEVAMDNKDPYTRFLATENNEKLLLQADNGKYMSRIYRGGINKIEAAKDVPDVACYFTVHNQPDCTVVLQANNGKFMSRMHRSGIDYYEAEKSQIDVYCKLRLEFQL